MNYPAIAEQNEAIREILEHSRTVSEMQMSPIRGKIPEGLKSHDMLLLEYGRPFYFDGETFKGRRMKQGECFANAYRLATSDDELTYVEGKVHIGVLPIDHAWVMTREGKVIDPTLKAPEKRGGSSVRPMGYFGIAFDTNYLYKVAARSGVYGILNGMTNRELFEGKDKDFLAEIWSGENVCV